MKQFSKTALAVTAAAGVALAVAGVADAASSCGCPVSHHHVVHRHHVRYAATYRTRRIAGAPYAYDEDVYAAPAYGPPVYETYDVGPAWYGGPIWYGGPFIGGWGHGWRGGSGGWRGGFHHR